MDALEGVVENLDNVQTKNNIKIRRLKQAIEGKDPIEYLVELFSEI